MIGRIYVDKKTGAAQYAKVVSSQKNASNGKEHDKICFIKVDEASIPYGNKRKYCIRKSFERKFKEVTK